MAGRTHGPGGAPPCARVRTLLHHQQRRPRAWGQVQAFGRHTSVDPRSKAAEPAEQSQSCGRASSALPRCPPAIPALRLARHAPVTCSVKFVFLHQVLPPRAPHARPRERHPPAATTPRLRRAPTPAPGQARGSRALSAAPCAAASPGSSGICLSAACRRARARSMLVLKRAERAPPWVGLFWRSTPSPAVGTAACLCGRAAIS